MVADVLLFKRDQITDRVSDVILIENKLSAKTRFTESQNMMIKLIKQKGPMNIRVRSLERSIEKDELLPLSSGSLIQIKGNGTTDIGIAQISYI